MEGSSAEAELEKRSKFLNSLILQKKKNKNKDQVLLEQKQDEFHNNNNQMNVRVRASDMPLPLQNHAFTCARRIIDDSMSPNSTKIDTKRLALALKKDFDSTYGPAWHCIVGTSFGSYVTHSIGGFLYFSIDKVYVLLFRTAVGPVVDKH